jgi:hypothetical protein
MLTLVLQILRESAVMSKRCLELSRDEHDVKYCVEAEPLQMDAARVIKIHVCRSPQTRCDQERLVKPDLHTRVPNVPAYARLHLAPATSTTT